MSKVSCENINLHTEKAMRKISLAMAKIWHNDNLLTEDEYEGMKSYIHSKKWRVDTSHLLCYNSNDTLHTDVKD